MHHATADLCDKHIDKLQVAEPIFIDFGSITSFEGEVHTLKVFEDNTLVRAALENDGTGKVLVVDGGGSFRCALVGDNLAALAIQNNWRGMVVFGCIRDSKQNVTKGKRTSKFVLLGSILDLEHTFILMKTELW